MHNKYRKTEVNSSKQLKTTGGTPHTVQKICTKQHTRQENHILKARVGFEGFKRAGEGSEGNYNTNSSITNTIKHTGEKTIEVQTHTGENTSQEDSFICNQLTSKIKSSLILR